MRDLFWVIYTIALIPFVIGVYKGLRGGEDKAINWIVASMVWAITCAVLGTILVPTEQSLKKEVVEKIAEDSEAVE